MYLSHRANDDLCARLWQGILVAIAGHEETALSTLEPLLRAAEGGQLPHTLAPSGEELDDVVGQLLVAGLSRKTGSSESLDLLRRVLANHCACFDGNQARNKLTQVYLSSFHQYRMSPRDR